MVWTASDTRPKGAAEDEPTQAQKMTAAFVKAKLKPQEPDEKEFASEIPQPGRKGEKGYHVKAFKGSKEGYLFFLPQGILWGFKKPLTLFSFPAISSVSYTSVLQRTFNLVVSARPLPPHPSSSSSSPNESPPPPPPPPQDHEFSMLEQADFAGIDAYVRRHGLQDASLAEARRAKKYNVNGAKKGAEEGAEGGGGGGGGGGAGGQGEDGEEEEETGELAKAQMEAEMRADDEEDDEEEDENFDPGSEGESEGSGTSDEEEEGGDGGGDEEGEEEGEEDEDDDDDEGAAGEGMGDE